MGKFKYILFSDRVRKNCHFDGVNREFILDIHSYARKTDTTEFYDNVVLGFVNRMMRNDLYKPSYLSYDSEVPEVVLLDNDGSVCESYPFMEESKTDFFVLDVIAVLNIAKQADDKTKAKAKLYLERRIDDIKKQDEDLGREYESLRKSACYFNVENARDDDDSFGGMDSFSYGPPKNVLGLMTSSFNFSRLSFLKDHTYELQSKWLDEFFRNAVGSDPKEYLYKFNQSVWRKNNHKDRVEMTNNASHLFKIIESVINDSIIQYIRMKMGIAMPEYFKRYCDSFDTMPITTGRSRFVSLNRYKEKDDSIRLESTSIGDTAYLLRTLSYETDFCQDELLSPFFDDDFVQLCIEMGKRRGFVVHDIEPIELEEFEKIFNLYRQFEKYSTELINLKQTVLAA